MICGFFLFLVWAREEVRVAGKSTGIGIKRAIIVMANESNHTHQRATAS